MFVVDTTLGRLAVLAVAVAVTVGFILWSRRTRSRAFFLGVLAGSGLFLTFDIIWIHWVFGLHHLTNTPEDVVLEPALVVAGVVMFWIGTRRGRESG
jgi:uncharacterized membrane protein